MILRISMLFIAVTTLSCASRAPAPPPDETGEGTPETPAQNGGAAPEAPLPAEAAGRSPAPARLTARKLSLRSDGYASASGNIRLDSTEVLSFQFGMSITSTQRPIGLVQAIFHLDDKGAVTLNLMPLDLSKAGRHAVQHWRFETDLRPPVEVEVSRNYMASTDGASLDLRVLAEGREQPALFAFRQVGEYGGEHTQTLTITLPGQAPRVVAPTNLGD